MRTQVVLLFALVAAASAAAASKRDIFRRRAVDDEDETADVVQGIEVPSPQLPPGPPPKPASKGKDPPASVPASQKDPPASKPDPKKDPPASKKDPPAPKPDPKKDPPSPKPDPKKDPPASKKDPPAPKPDPKKDPPASKKDPPAPKPDPKKTPPASKPDPKKDPPASKKDPPASKKDPPASKPDPKKDPPASKKDPPASKQDPKKTPPASKPDPKKDPPASKKDPPASKKDPPASKPDPKKDPPASKKDPPASKPDPKKNPPASKPDPKKDPPASKKDPPASKPDPKKNPPASKKDPPASKPDPKKDPPASKKDPPASKPDPKKDPPASKKDPPASKPASKEDPKRPPKPASKKDPPASKPTSKEDPGTPSKDRPSKEKSSKENPPAVQTGDVTGCGPCVAGKIARQVLPGYGCVYYKENEKTMRCPNGYLFDPKVCACNKESAVTCPANCASNSQPPLEPSRPPVTILTHSGCATCKSWNVEHSVVAKSDCRFYTKEMPGLGPVKHECGDGLTFDPTLCSCTYAHAAQCPSSCHSNPPQPASTPAAITTRSTPAISTSSTPRPVVLTTPAITTKSTPAISTSSTPRPVVLTTPAITTRSTPAISTSSTPQPVVLTTPQSDCGWCSSRGGVTHRVKAGQGCKQFTKDTPGDGTLYTCPSGQLFDPVLCMCNYEHVVKCPTTCGGELLIVTPPATPKPTTTPTPTKPAVVTLVTPPHTCDTCYVQGTTHRIQAGRGCKEFTKDSNGDNVIYSCPQGQLFDKVLCMCNYDYVVKCPSQCGGDPVTVAPSTTTERPTPTQPASTTIAITLSTPPHDCGSCFVRGTTHRVKAGEGCKVYTKDSTGSGVELSCPTGQLFDPVLCMCNYAHVVKCPTTCGTDVPTSSSSTKEPTTPVRPVQTTTPVVLTRPPFDCGTCISKGVVHRVQPGQGCKRFVKDTAAGDSVEYACPNDLVFDPELCMCNYAHVVRCPVACGGQVPSTTTEKPTVPTTTPTRPQLTTKPIVSSTPAEKPTIPPTTSTPLQPSTTPIILTTPPHECGSCSIRGVVHRVFPGLGCKEYTRETEIGGERAHFTCSAGLLFDPVLCMCNYQHVVNCPTKCGTDAPPTQAPTTPSTTVPTTTRGTTRPPFSATATPTTTVPATKETTPPLPSGSPVCGICADSGSVYEIVPGTACTEFAHHGPGIAAVRYACSEGLAFDQTLCSCNWKHAVACPLECGGDGHPPSAVTTVSPPKTPATVATTTMTPTVQTPPAEQDACGKCSTAGDTYRLVKGSGCRKFSPDTPGMAAQVIECPAGLVFDLTLCACNYDYAVTCSKECSTFINPPTEAKSTTPKPEVTTPVVVGKPSCGVCQSDGIVFEIVANTDCTSFTKQAAGMAASRLVCPAGLVFDTNLCACNYKDAFECTATCDGRPPRPPTVAVTAPTPSRAMDTPTPPTSEIVRESGCKVCTTGGSVYRPVAGSGCRKFREETAVTSAQDIECPAGLLFDTHLCACNYDYAVKCDSNCGTKLINDDRPSPRPEPTPCPTQTPDANSATTPARPPHVIVTQPPGRPPVDQFIPNSGCRACQAGGNTYRALPGCRSFTEESATIAPRKLDCPAGLVFDTTLCVCNYEYAVTCASDCGNVPQPPTIPPDVVRPPTGITDRPPIIPNDDGPGKVTVGCGQCQAGGNTYRTVAGSGCMAFTEEAHGIAPRRYACPEGLVFDTNLCVCNWREAVQCSATCGGRPPVINTTPHPQAGTQPPGRPPVDQFIPNSGCGACQAGGNTYRALPGCRSFTEESATIAPRKLDCPTGLMFDSTLCVCNYEYAVQCASDCGNVPQPPTIPPDVVRPPTGIVDRPPIIPSDDTKVHVGCGQCQAGGNTYRTLAGSSCMAFTEEARGIAPRRYVCPDGLVFDTNLCVCNWREAVQCSSTCNGQPPALSTTPRLPGDVVTQPPGRPPVDQFIPNSGCGACQVDGSTYRALPGCRSFTEESSAIAPRKIDCPAGLVFDTTLCVCNYEYAVTCASDCGSVPQPPTIPPIVIRPPTEISNRPPISTNDDGWSKVTSGCGQCKAGGNTYRVVPGSNCKAFTEEAPGIAPRRNMCPEELVFDTHLCVCNWPEAVQCTTKCDSEPPKTDVGIVTSPPQVNTLPTGRPPVDQFIPVSGCGACLAYGNTYRALPGCRSFTEETATVAPKRMDCAAGLLFDTTLCVCNYEYAVTCATDCGSVPQPPTKPTASPTLRPPIVITNRPPVVPSGDDPTKVITGCGSCEAGGNIYRIFKSSGCTAFTEEAPGIASSLNICPAGLLFDTNLCVCNWAEAVQCSTKCDLQPPATAKNELTTPKPTVPVVHVGTECGVCKTGCTVFRVLEDGGSCNAFTEDTEGAPALVRRQCPAGLAFDAELCMCSWKETTKCACGVRQSHPLFTPPPKKVDVSPRPSEHVVAAPVNIDRLKTVPSGCGTCAAGGIIFRTVPGTGCVSFTKETATHPPVRFECNAGLVFDVSICGCNYKDAVKCGCVGDGKP